MKEGQVFHRRSALKFATLVPLGMFLESCGMAKSSPKAPASELGTAYVLPESPVPSAVASYYPELRDIPRKSEGIIRLNEGVTMTWANYTKYNLNPATAEQMYLFFQSEIFGPDPLEAKIIYGNKIVPFKAFPRSQIKDKAVFIVDDQAPYPKISTVKPNAATKIIDDRSYFSYVRVSDSESKPTSANRNLAIEACQAFIKVGVLPSDNPEAIIPAQELFANSLGLAFSLKQEGSSYSEYTQAIKSIKVPSAAGNYVLRFAENIYNKIPVVGAVLEKRVD